MLAWLDTKISNVKEEKKKVTRGVWMHHTPPRQGSPLTVKKKEKVKSIKHYKVTGCLKILRVATWLFGRVVIPLPKKLHSSIRVWVQSPGSSNICVCEFILEFLSYLKKKKKMVRLAEILNCGYF